MVEENAAPAEQETVEDLMEGGEIGILENDPLNSLFGEEEPVEKVKEEEAVTAPTEPEKVIVDPVVTTDEEPKPAVAKDPDSGWKAAYFAEKGKRQKLEKATPPPEPTTFDWTNPEKTIAGIKSELRQESQTNFLNMSQAQAEARHEDFGEKYQIFTEMARQNPAIIQSMLGQPDPAQYAYDLAEGEMFRREVGQDPAAYREKIAAEERLKIETEFKTKAGKTAALAASLPPSAANLSDNVPTNKAPAAPFEALFPGDIPS